MTQQSRRTPTTAIAGVALAALLALAALPAPVHADAASAAAGAELYKSKCVGCHGADGSGNTPMGKALKVQDLRKPDLQARKDADLAASITNGKGKMPPQKANLTPAQVNQIVEYVRTLGKGK
jgi:cytochrome c6